MRIKDDPDSEVMDGAEKNIGMPLKVSCVEDYFKITMLNPKFYVLFPRKCLIKVQNKNASKFLIAMITKSINS